MKLVDLDAAYNELYDAVQCRAMLEYVEYDAIINILDTLPVINGWISVKDRLPTEQDADGEGFVIAVTKKHKQSRFWFWDIVARYHNEFSYWMSVLEPPVEE